MTLRGGHGPHTADWRATRDKEMLEVDMSEDALVTELWETREEVCRLRHELERLRDECREDVPELRMHCDEDDGSLAADRVDEIADRIDTILRGDNHE